MVAESWDISADGLTYTFHIRKGIKFHDGTQLDASDVEFTMKRYVEVGSGLGAWFTRYITNNKLIDQWTVQFTIKEKYAPFLYKCATLYIMNKDLVKQHLKSGPYGDWGDYGQEWCTTNDAGSGPYYVKEFRLEDKLIMDLFEDYWGLIRPRAPKEWIMIGTCEPMTVRTLMKNGEAEMSDQWQSPENFEALAAIPGVKIANLNVGGYAFIYVNNGRPPTDDVHFRLALSYLTDYDKIVSLWPGTTRLKGAVPDYILGFNKNLKYPTFNMTKAEEELKQSKYYGQLDQYPVYLWWSTDVPVEEKICTSFAENAQKLGIKVEVTDMPWSKCIEAAAVKDQCPNGIVMISSVSWPEANSVFDQFSSTYKTTNFLWIENETVDSLITDMMATIDTGERLNKEATFQQLAVDQAFSIYILQIPEQHAYTYTYVDWPAANGQVISLSGANSRWNEIELYTEKKP